ncbi:MAG: uncharacterized protein KVP18_001689 [Porospora cf. gigantea A]|uniref:uncharacterized protein n=1 Tax=Porospora cf. gigantea A TaxID=2853593 RepID=UPI00355A224A|nr:MAG: hypothetical protein KVP18_001689 [Porospora cf. gigantea A]
MPGTPFLDSEEVESPYYMLMASAVFSQPQAWDITGRAPAMVRSFAHFFTHNSSSGSPEVNQASRCPACTTTGPSRPPHQRWTGVSPFYWCYPEVALRSGIYVWVLTSIPTSGPAGLCVCSLFECLALSESTRSVGVTMGC